MLNFVWPTSYKYKKTCGCIWKINIYKMFPLLSITKAEASKNIVSILTFDDFETINKKIDSLKL